MNTQSGQRLAKWIAATGYCSRRAAERLIAQQRVLCNGRAAKHTDVVTEQDDICIDNQPLPVMPARHYMLYHKPVGVDCNNRPDDPASLYQLLKTLPQRLFAVGRLDKDSCGLLLLTNDGDLSQKLMHPDYYHEKAYLVETRQLLNDEFIRQMAAGVSWQLGSNSYHSRPCQVQQLTDYRFSITLTQGLHRQIRYMCKTLGYQVLSLQRVRLHNLLLGELAAGALRPVTEQELAQLRLLSAQPQPET
jgi:16S rRNA pseudouridine516 synthase